MFVDDFVENDVCLFNETLIFDGWTFAGRVVRFANVSFVGSLVFVHLPSILETRNRLWDVSLNGSASILRISFQNCSFVGSAVHFAGHDVKILNSMNNSTTYAKNVTEQRSVIVEFVECTFGVNATAVFSNTMPPRMSILFRICTMADNNTAFSQHYVSNFVQFSQAALNALSIQVIVALNRANFSARNLNREQRLHLVIQHHTPHCKLLVDTGFYIAKWLASRDSLALFVSGFQFVLQDSTVVQFVRSVFSSAASSVVPTIQYFVKYVNVTTLSYLGFVNCSFGARMLMNSDTSSTLTTIRSPIWSFSYSSMFHFENIVLNETMEFLLESHLCDDASGVRFVFDTRSLWRISGLGISSNNSSLFSTNLCSSGNSAVILLIELNHDSMMQLIDVTLTKLFSQPANITGDGTIGARCLKTTDGIASLSLNTSYQTATYLNIGSRYVDIAACTSDQCDAQLDCNPFFAKSVATHQIGSPATISCAACVCRDVYNELPFLKIGPLFNDSSTTSPPISCDVSRIPSSRVGDPP